VQQFGYVNEDTNFVRQTTTGRKIVPFNPQALIFLGICWNWFS